MVSTVQVQALPPVPSAQSVTQNEYITQAWGQWFIQLRDKVNTINATIAQIAGDTPTQTFDSLSPLTTAGDMLTYSGGHNVRLPIGTNGYVLTVVSGAPSWQPPSGGGGSTLTVNNQTASYTLVLTDQNSIIVLTNAASNTITIPTNASVAFPVGTQILGMQGGTGGTKWSPTTGVTTLFASLATSVKNAVGRIIKIASDTWVVDLALGVYLIYKTYITGESPIAYWTFDNTLASEVGSFTWTYNSGTVLTYVTPLIAQGNAANFSVGDAYYSIPYDASFNTLTFSIEIWVSFTTTSNQVIFECNGNTGFSLQDNLGKLQLNIGGTSTTPVTANTINDGTRHHVVFVCTSSSQRVYLDGALNNTHSFSLTNNLASQPLYLGSRAGSVGYTGTIDELAFYNYNLTPTQILNHYTIGTE